MTRVSVCMATYNGEKFIERQLNSILSQLSTDDELIISDDSSVDNTAGIVQSYSDNRIRFLPHQKFKSPIYNFENALRQAKGKYVFLADQDDLWMSDKVAEMLQALEDADLVLSDCNLIDARDQEIAPSFFKMHGSKRGLLRNIIRNSYLGCCMAMRREVLLKSLPFPDDIPMHDWWIGVVGEAFFKVAFLHKPLMGYRRHGVNATPTGEGSHYPYFRRLVFRINLVKGLASVWIKQ